MTTEFKDSIFGKGAKGECSITPPTLVYGANLDSGFELHATNERLENELQMGSPDVTGLNIKDFDNARMAVELGQEAPTTAPEIGNDIDVGLDASLDFSAEDSGTFDGPDLSGM